MYPSGSWRGFWQQEGFGRQPMEQFELRFDGGTITGQGTDIVGPFLFKGTYDSAGKVDLIKQYIARHAVIYHGEPDGEGSILGTWSIDVKQFGVGYRGPFLMQPVTRQRVEDLPIISLSPRRGEG